MNRVSYFIVLMLSSSAASAASPQLQQFARGINVMPQSTQPLVQVPLPEEVYRTVTRNDLADMRVFDRNGDVVPYALCAAPESDKALGTVIEVPVVELQRAMASGGGAQVKVQTAGGTHVEVREPSSTSPPAVGTQAHVIDATGIEETLRAIEFDWSTADGSSEAHVRIEASDDLDRWDTIVGNTTLLRAGRDGQLRRERVTLPQRRYRYLRVERADGGPPIHIQGVRAEKLSLARRVEPFWFAATLAETKDDGLLFKSNLRAPIQYARFKLPLENMTVRVTLSSRREGRFPWVKQWQGEVYSVIANGEHKASEPAKLAAVTDQAWLVQVNGGNTPAVGLELGYRPSLLRFAAQGMGPFTLAFGSRQVETPAALGCNQLLSNVEPTELQAMIGEAVMSPPRVLGGDDALKPLPKKTPLRLIVLWGVLIVGVTLLVAMAVSLLKRVRE